MTRKTWTSNRRLAVFEAHKGIQANTSAIEAARDAELAALNSQMNALLGIDNSVMSVAGAIANLAAAQRAVDAAVGGRGAGSSVSDSINSGTGNSVINAGQIINDSGSYGLSSSQQSAIRSAYVAAFGEVPNGAYTTWGRAIT